MVNESEILFVNKSAKSKSLSRSNGAERARIFSHVQKNPQSKPAPPITTLDPHLNGSAKAIVWQALEQPTKKSKPRLGRDRQSNPPSRDHSPHSAIGLAVYDPFETTAAPITPYMNRVLEFYNGKLFNAIFPNEIMAEASRKHTLSYASQDAASLYGVLCTTAGALHLHCKDERDGLHAMYFKGQTIHHIKKELSKNDGSEWKMSTLYAVSLLLWVECLQGDMSAVEAHTKGLDFLVSRVSRLYQSPLPIMTTILSCHYYCCAMLQTQPTIKPTVLCADSVSSSTRTALHDAFSTPVGRMCSQFFTPANTSILGIALPAIIQDQQRCLHFKEICSSSLVSPTLEDINYTYTLQASVDFELLDLPYSTSIELTPIQDAGRLALYIIALPIARVVRTPSAFSRSMAQQIKKAIDQCNVPELIARNAELLLWILFVATYVSQGKEEWPGLIAYMAMAVEALEVESEAEMEEVLTGFVYSRAFCGAALDAAWVDVEVVLRRTSEGV